MSWSPRVLKVIESFDKRGKGTDEDPVRRVKQYHTLDGKFLAEEKDPDGKLTVKMFQDDLKKGGFE